MTFKCTGQIILLFYCCSSKIFKQSIPEAIPMRTSSSSSVSCSTVSDSLLSHGLQPTRLLHPWDSRGTNTGVGGHALLQGIFLTPGIEPRSLELQAYSSPSKPTGKPKPQREVLKLQKIKKSYVTKYYLFNYYSLHSAFNGFNLTSYPTFRMNKSFLSLNVMWLCVCVCVRACVRVCVC